MEVYLNKSIDIVTVDHNWSKEEALRFVESNGIANLDDNIKAGFVLAMPRLATPGGFGETARIIDNGTGKRHMLHEFVDTPSLRKELWDHSGVIAMPLTESLDGDPMNIPLEVETRIRVMMANDGRIDEDSLINIHTVHPDGSETVEQETVGSMLKRLNEEETAARQAETSEQETRGIGAPTPGDSFDNWLKAQAVSEGALKKAEAFPDGSTLHERLIEDAQAAATAYTSALWKDTPDLDIFPEIDREAVIASIKGLYARGFDAEVLSDPRRRHIELDSPGEYGNQVAGDALRAWCGAVGPQPHLENIGDQIYKAVMAATAKEYERLNMYVRPTARMAPEAIQDAMDSFDDKIRARIKSVFDEEGFPLDELTATATPLERRGELLADLNRHADTVRKKIKEFLLETVDEREKIGLRTLYPSVVTKTFLKRLDTETREIMYLQGRFPKLENGQTLESVRAAIKETEVRLEKEESLYDRLSAGMGHSPGVPDTTDALRNELSALRALEKRYPDVSIKEPVNEGEKQEDVKKEQEQDTRAQEPSRAVGSQRKLPEQNPFMKGFNEGRNFFEGVLLGLINVFNEMFWASPEDDHFKLGTMPDAAAKEAADAVQPASKKESWKESIVKSELYLTIPAESIREDDLLKETLADATSLKEQLEATGRYDGYLKKGGSYIIVERDGDGTLLYADCEQVRKGFLDTLKTEKKDTVTLVIGGETFEFTRKDLGEIAFGRAVEVRSRETGEYVSFAYDIKEGKITTCESFEERLKADLCRKESEGIKESIKESMERGQKEGQGEGPKTKLN